MSPAVSPYFARPGTSRTPRALSFSVGGGATPRSGSSSTPRGDLTWGTSPSPAVRASTATAGGRAKREWAAPNARDEVDFVDFDLINRIVGVSPCHSQVAVLIQTYEQVMLFDPNLGRYDQQWQSWRERNHALATKSEDRESQVPPTSPQGSIKPPLIRPGARDWWCTSRLLKEMM